MFRLMPLHSTGEIWCGVILGSACNYGVAKHFTTPLTYFLSFLSRTSLFQLFKHVKQFQRLDVCNRMLTDEREDIFVEGFKNVRGISRRPFLHFHVVPFERNLLKGVFYFFDLG